MELETWETRVQPYPTVDPSNGMNMKIFKRSNICMVLVDWVGSVSQNEATLDEISIPEKFRPTASAYGYTPAIVGSVINNGGTRIEIRPDGKLHFVTNIMNFVERMVTLTYVCADIV